MMGARWDAEARSTPLLTRVSIIVLLSPRASLTPKTTWRTSLPNALDRSMNRIAAGILCLRACRTNVATKWWPLFVVLPHCWGGRNCSMALTSGARTPVHTLADLRWPNLGKSQLTPWDLCRCIRELSAHLSTEQGSHLCAGSSQVARSIRCRWPRIRLSRVQQGSCRVPCCWANLWQRVVPRLWENRLLPMLPWHRGLQVWQAQVVPAKCSFHLSLSCSASSAKLPSANLIPGSVVVRKAPARIKRYVLRASPALSGASAPLAISRQCVSRSHTKQDLFSISFL